ncbi:MAG: SsrA-binding protein, partial [Lactococcus lactis]|nr:SsrA-binding protein [Lactococcus lactis]
GIPSVKKDYDKRETLKRKEQNRDIARQIKAYNR